MARYIMIVVLGGMLTFGIANINQNSVVNQGTQNAVDNFSTNRSHDIATSMVDILLMRLANDFEYRVNSDASEELFGGKASYVVENVYFEGDSLVKLKVVAGYNDVSKTIIAYIGKPTDGWVPPIVRGAWTANATLNNTISDMYLDGRNHDLSLNIIPETGTFGVSSGGTNNGVDYPMSFPEDPAVIEENYNWDGGFPESPDKILGFPEGTLKAAAQTGEHGSQYLSVPGGTKNIDSDLLTYPLSGITYIDVPNGSDDMTFYFEQNGNSGILVIHSDDGSSRMKGVKFDKNTSDGLFTGLLVGDYTFHHHHNVLGAIILLSTDLEDSKNCNGNKDHWVKYSTDSVEDATEIVAQITGLSDALGYGFGQKRLNVKYVYE